MIAMTARQTGLPVRMTSISYSYRAPKEDRCSICDGYMFDDEPGKVVWVVTGYDGKNKMFPRYKTQFYCPDCAEEHLTGDENSDDYSNYKENHL